MSAALISTVALYACATDDTQVADRTLDTADTAGLAGATPDFGTDPGMGAAADTAMTVELVDREGQPIGTVRLSDTGQGVRLAVEASNLPPGERGFHFHETGRCDPPAFESAGSHFNPTGNQHGLENPEGPHAGDMENLSVGEDGNVNTTITTPRVTLRQGEPNSLLDQDGTALVIHAGQDDQRTDPSGDSGDRIACAAISGGATATTGAM